MPDTQLLTLAACSTCGETALLGTLNSIWHWWDKTVGAVFGGPHTWGPAMSTAAEF